MDQMVREMLGTGAAATSTVYLERQRMQRLWAQRRRRFVRGCLVAFYSLNVLLCLLSAIIALSFDQSVVPRGWLLVFLPLQVAAASVCVVEARWHARGRAPHFRTTDRRFTSPLRVTWPSLIVFAASNRAAVGVGHALSAGTALEWSWWLILGFAATVVLGDRYLLARRALTPGVS